jgi:hypothetical protein
MNRFAEDADGQGRKRRPIEALSFSIRFFNRHEWRNKTSGRCFTPREVHNASEREAEAPLDMDQQHIAKAVVNKQQHQGQFAGYDGSKA